MIQVPQYAASLPAEQGPDTTIVNISIQDSKHFPSDIAPVDELYSELATIDGIALFECEGLVKATGMDLMDCPLNVLLTLRVRRRLPQGPLVLWHVVLPLSVISKNLMQPPHEWETWLGLFPNTQSLAAHSPETMFTQAVHLISRPEFPKLRLKFTYRNPELQMHMALKKQCEQENQDRRTKIGASYGLQQFRNLQDLTRGLGAKKAPADADKTLSSTQSSQNMPEASEALEASNAKLQEALSCALRFISSMNEAANGAPSATSSSELTLQEVLASSVPGEVVEMHCAQLQQRSLAALATAQQSPSGAAADEQDLAEGLRYALMGMLEDSGGSTLPRTSAGLSSQSTDQLSTVRQRYPVLWEVYREVSKLALERLALMEQLGGFPLGPEPGTEDAAELRRQLEERDEELRQLRAQLAAGKAASTPQLPQVDLL